MGRFLSFVVVGAGLVWAPEAGGQSFSIDAGSPEITVGVQGAVGQGALQPGEIYIPLASYGPVVLPVAPPAAISFVAISPGEVNAMSFGRPPSAFSAGGAAFFSLDRASSGVAGTASANEFNFGAGVSEQSSDVFRSVFNGTNTIHADGDGVVQVGNPNPAAFPLGTGEFATFPFPPGPIPPLGGADLDAYDLRANLLGAGSPTGRFFYSLDPASAGGIGSSAGDVLVDPTGLGGVANLYASEMQLGTLPLGIPPGSNDIDALVVFDDGDNQFAPGTDIVLFSLAPGSIYLGQMDPNSGLAIEAGDILIDEVTAQALYGLLPGSGAAILHTAESLGLLTVRSGSLASDNLNALDVIPEPSSLLLLVLGGSLGLLRGKRLRTRFRRERSRPTH